MMALGRQICATLAALAVLTVSMTCTPAGCLLAMGPRGASEAAHACCAGRPSQGDPGKLPLDGGKCRLCHSSIFTNQSVAGSPDLGLRLLCLPLATVATLPSPCPTCVDGLTHPSLSAIPHTLLSLHCALLS
ncbi:MAG TPA: hypothetical protein VK797_13375 [Tepidisphaeraceae bacterium]|nr:hypothetical protein [Tepidisphaeraceae bacterium]